MKKLSGFFLLERIPNAPPFVFSLGDAGFVNKYFKEKHQLSLDPGDELNIYEDGAFLFHYQIDSLRACATAIFNKIIDDPRWAIETDESILQTANDFMNYCHQIEQKDLSQLTNDEVAKVCEEWFFKYFHDSWLSGWPTVLVDFEKNLFSNYLLNYLKQKLKSKKLSATVGDVFSILTTPLADTFAQQETIALLNLVKQVKKQNPTVLETWSPLIAHYQQYCWLPFMYTGPAWDMKYFSESLQSLLRQKIDPNQALKEIKEKGKQLKKKQTEYLERLEIHDNHQIIFEAARRFVYSKSFRKDAMYYGCYVLDKVLREVAKRTFLSLEQVQRVYPWEISDLLMGKGPEVQVLNERKYAIQYSSTTSSKMRVTLEGKTAKEFVAKINFIKQKFETPSEILGDCASVGKVRGTVKIVNSPKEISKMKDGNVLVSYATSPDIMPAIKKAVAIVTDLGGIICHAAIVSRELHIPCVVGTKIATQFLKDGDIIEVDATHGIIRLIK